MSQGADIGRVRQLNRRLVLRQLRACGRATRADLAKETGLTHATVSAIVAALVDEGWVRDVGIGALPRGRPPVLLEIDARNHCSIGLQIAPEWMRVDVLDALGRPVATREVKTRSRAAKTVCKRAAKLVRDTLSGAGVDRQRIHAVGVTVPGPVEPCLGLAVDVPELGWRNAPIRQLLADELGMPVEVYDETYVLACLELLEGKAQGARNAVLLSVAVEPAAVLIIEGRIHRGANGLAGAIGHMQMPGLEGRCHCGNVGCLRTIVSREAFALHAAELMQSGNNGIDRARLEELPSRTVIAAAVAGNTKALEIVVEASLQVTRAASWILNLVNPDLLILGAGFSWFPEEMLHPFRDGLLAACPRPLSAGLRIETSTLTSEDRARAAGLVALYESVDHLDQLFHDSTDSAVA